MCGICGVLTFAQDLVPDAAMQSVRTMTRLMVRRGPDDEGYWSDPAGRLHLGFRRLAVIDPTPAAHQPMLSADGQSVLIFNGEIFNYRDLRHELEQAGTRFRSRSDTEVLLEALGRWGIAALDRLNGMFAFAWYDGAQRRLLLARDHAGVKPLYYYRHPQGRGLVFGSQYNQLLHAPWGHPGSIRPDVLRLYLQLHHLPPPYGLLANTYQLEPGHYLSIDDRGRIEKRAWWVLPRNPQPSLSGTAAVDALEAALERAVRRQRVADVPLGVFLSGGIDSPLVTAVARRQTSHELKAFTIGSRGWWQDESADAIQYARHLHVDHRVHFLQGEDVLAAMPDVIAAQHEPFGDFSIIPTLLVSQFARQEVTVALSGDGGDEILFGYERPRSLLRHGRDFRWPWPVRAGIYAAGKWGLVQRRSDTILARTPGDYYFGVNCRLHDADLRVVAPGLNSLPEDFDLYRFDGRYRGDRHLVNYSRWVEFYGQLQRGLKKVDMASMHYGLEVRVPLLDREVIETSLQIEPLDSLRNGDRKAVLRSLLSRFVPAEAIPTAKRGFAVPLDDWLTGALRPLVEDSLFGDSAAIIPWFERRELRRYWDDHVSGRRNHKWGLWTILSLQWWLAAASAKSSLG